MKHIHSHPIFMSIVLTVISQLANAVQNPVLILPPKSNYKFEVHFNPGSDDVIYAKGTDKDPGKKPERATLHVAHAEPASKPKTESRLFTGPLVFMGVPWNSEIDGKVPRRSHIKPMRHLKQSALVLADKETLMILDYGKGLNEKVHIWPRPLGNIVDLEVVSTAMLHAIALQTENLEGVWIYDSYRKKDFKISEKFIYDLEIEFTPNGYRIHGAGGFNFRHDPNDPTNATAAKTKLSESRALVVVKGAGAVIPTSPPAAEEKAKPQAEVVEEKLEPLSLEEQQAKLKKFNGQLKDLNKLMDSMVVGQPEAVQAFVDIEKTDFANGGRRRLPEVVMLTGLPETGKDTTTESYLIAKAKLKRLQSPLIENTTKENRPNENRIKPLSLHEEEDLVSSTLTEHLFRVSAVKNELDIATLIGSGPGYVGSKELTPLIKWLVKHSGGRYTIVKAADNSEYVTESPNWYPGTVKTDYFSPTEGVLFINEVHDWSKSGKNQFLKEALEKGFFTIRNPGAGLARIEVPITIAMASNDCIGRILAIDRDGQRIGAPLTDEQKFERWQKAHLNYADLKQDMMAPTVSNREGGMTHEMLSRIPNSRLILMRPLARNDLYKLADIKLFRIGLSYAQLKFNGFPSFRIKTTQKLSKFVVDFDYNTEMGARSLSDKIQSLIVKTINDAIFALKLKPTPQQRLELDVATHKDGTSGLLVDSKDYFIYATAKEKSKRPMTPERIQELLKLEDELNARVKGLEHITKQLADDVRMSLNSPLVRPADVYMFLGSSSTGKTELAKALHQVLTKSNTEPLVIDCGRLYSRLQVEQLILGLRDSNNRSIDSDFMQYYDRNDGEMVLVLDEISNAPKEVQMALYDLLREGEITRFSDKWPRKMGRVKIIMTGNAGEEWYQGIPREASEAEQWRAARDIYLKAIANPDSVRRFLMSRFSEAFLNRVQAHRIFFFGPHTYKTIRELIQLKLVSALKSLREGEKETITWNVQFLQKVDYMQTIEAIETYGFKLWEQGASIKGFIDNVLLKRIHLALLDNLIPKGSKVHIVKGEDVLSKKADEAPKIGFKLFVEGREKPIEIFIEGKIIPKSMRMSAKSLALTAYHEAGHALVRQVLMGYNYKSNGIEIVPGVTEINGNWIQYLGIARHSKLEYDDQFYHTVVNDIAVLAGGYMAEMLTTKGAVHSSGKSNDIQRATNLAQMAVASGGLSDFGIRSKQPEQSLDAFVLTLTPEEKEKFSTAVQNLLKEGQELARKVIIANYDEFLLPMGQHLAKKGRVSGETLERFFASKKNLMLHPEDFAETETRIQEFEQRVSKEGEASRRRDFDFYSFSEIKGSIVDIDLLQKQEKQAELAKADLSPMQKVLATAEDIRKIRASLMKEKVLLAGRVMSLAAAVQPPVGSCQRLF